MVKYKTVIKPVPEKYEELAPERVRYMLRGNKMHAIEAQEEDGRRIGMLAYSYSDKTAELIWIYVLPSERSRGTGSALMEKFFSKIQGFEFLYADLIVTDESAPLQSFLMAYRFRFQKDISYMFLKGAGELKRSQLLERPAIAQDCESLKDISIECFREIMTGFGLEPRVYDTEYLDLALSSLHRDKKGNVNGILLVNRYGRKLVEPVLLRAKADDMTIEIKLLKSSLYLLDKLGSGASVYVKCISAQSGALIDMVLEDTHPIRVMHGICRG